MSGIPTLEPISHQRLQSPKAPKVAVNELNPYMELVESHDSLDLSSQASLIEPSKPGKMKRLYYKALDLFSPTSLPAIQKATQRLSQQHLTQIDSIQHALENYLQLRADYKNYRDTLPKKAPRALSDAQKQYKAHAKQLKAHIQLLERAHRIHGNAFVDTKRVDLNRAYDKVTGHLETLKDETESLFPKKPTAVLSASLYLDYAEDAALKQIKNDLEHSRATLSGHVLPELL